MVMNSKVVDLKYKEFWQSHEADTMLLLTFSRVRPAVLLVGKSLLSPQRGLRSEQMIHIAIAKWRRHDLASLLLQLRFSQIEID
jgi:hypothetical protein